MQQRRQIQYEGKDARFFTLLDSELPSTLALGKAMFSLFHPLSLFTLPHLLYYCLKQILSMCLHYLESPSGHTEKPISHCYTFCFTFQTCFRKLKKRRKVYNMHLPIFLLSCSSLFLCQDSFNYHFLSISRNSVSHSFMVGRLATHPLSFPLPDTLLISPSF